MMSKKIFIVAALLLMPLQALAEGKIDLGMDFDGWTSNYLGADNGYELFVPLSFTYQLEKGFSVYGQTEFANANYTSTDSTSITTSTTLTNLSDSIIGTELHFKSFSLNSIVNVAVNIPTGDPTWETKEYASNIPTEFIDTRYQGRGFGMSALYGLSFPDGRGEFGAAAGYLYSGAFNPSYGTVFNPTTQLKLGDAVFVAVNHVTPYSGDQNEIIRVTGYQSFPTQTDGQNVFQLGTNFIASYKWSNPSAFSFEAGAQYFLPSGRLNSTTGVYGTEADNSYAPRFYVTPSYTFGDFAIAGNFKYILQNDYSTSNALYDGGGFLAGIEPSYHMKLDEGSSLLLSASYSYIYAINKGLDPITNVFDANATYSFFTVGATYELKL